MEPVDLKKLADDADIVDVELQKFRAAVSATQDSIDERISRAADEGLARIETARQLSASLPPDLVALVARADFASALDATMPARAYVYRLTMETNHGPIELAKLGLRWDNEQDKKLRFLVIALPVEAKP